MSRETVGIICLLITATGWALNWPLMKFLLRDWPPMFSRGVGGVMASLALAAVAHLCGQTLRVPRKAIPRLLFAAFTNVIAWMGFATFAMKWISVGEGILLVFTMPIWATLFAWPLLGDRPSAKGFAALVLGFAGVGVILSAQTLATGGGARLGIAFAIGSAVFFAPRAQHIVLLNKEYVMAAQKRAEFYDVAAASNSQARQS